MIVEEKAVEEKPVEEPTGVKRIAGKLHLWVNPIIVKELRSRMRGVRAFATLTGVLLVLGIVSYVLFQLVMVTSTYSSTPLSPMIGQTLFAGLAFLELIIVCGITPAVTAGAISGERERETYEMLLATPLKPASILWGKLISALGYVFLLVFAAVPMASLVFIFGGVAPRDMIKALAILLMLSVMFGVIGLFFSALFGRTGRATVVTYLVVFLMLFAPGFLAVAMGVIRQAEPPRWVLVPSPINALFSALAPSMSSDLGSLFSILGGSFWFITGDVVSQTTIPRPLYHYSLPLFGLITVVLYLLTIRLVIPTRRWKIGWKNALIAAIVLLVFSAGIYLAFWSTSDRYENFSDLTGPRTEVQRNVSNSPPVVVEAVAALTATPIDAPNAAGAADAYPPPSGPSVTQAVETAAPAAGTLDAETPNPFLPTPMPQGGGAAPASPVLEEADEAAAYLTIVRHLLEQNDFSEQLEGLRSLILRDVSDDSIAPQDLDFPEKPPAAFQASVKEQIEEGVEEMGLAVRWESVPEFAEDEVDAAILLLGNFHQDEQAGVQAPGVLLLRDGQSLARLYTLEKQDGIWRVTAFEEK